MACPECFAHPWLRDYVAGEAKRKGTCPSCGKRGQPLVPVFALYGPFKNLLSCYERADGFGTPIFDLIQDDWDVFSDRLIKRGGAKGLVRAIMNSGWDDDDGEPFFSPTEHYVRHDWNAMTLVDLWREFALQVVDDPARPLTFRGSEFDEFLFREDLPGQRAVHLPAGTCLHRARLGFEGRADDPKPFAGPAIHAPPPDTVRPGRANAVGKIVLYCADQKATAVAEMRPARGEYVSVAEILVRKDLQILDLVSSPEALSPFVEEALSYWIDFSQLLSAFAEQLAKPLRSRDDLRDYIPTQKLAETIERAGLAGIRYPSAMAPSGTNVVLFDPSVADAGTSSLVEIVDVRIDYEGVL